MPQPEFSGAQPHTPPPRDERIFAEDEPGPDLDSPEEGIDFAEVEEKVRAAILAHPFVALGAAVATGYLAGRLFRR